MAARIFVHGHVASTTLPYNWPTFALHSVFHFSAIPGWQKLCEGTKGLHQKVWTKILSPNIRYIVAILRFVALYKASFRPDSDKRQLHFVQTQILSSRFRRFIKLPFVHTQTKDSDSDDLKGMPIYKWFWLISENDVFCRELANTPSPKGCQLLPHCAIQ